MSNESNFIYANGYTIAQARKFFKFYFGDFFLKANKNEELRRFDVYLVNKVKDGEGNLLSLEDYNDLDYFNEYWNDSMKNPAFNVMVMSARL